MSEMELTGYDLVNNLNNLQIELRNSLRKLRETGTDYAKKERDYRVLLRQEVLKMRDDGQAIGIISLVCHGIPEVAEAKMNRDIAEATYKANIEAINVLKLQIRVLENQIGREWSNGE